MRRAIQLNRAPLLIAFGLVVALGSAALFKAAHADVITSTDTSFTGFGVTNPCVPELVRLTGNVHSTFHFTVDQNGGLHLGIHQNTQGLSGEGSVTLVKYQVNRAQDQELNFTSLPFESTSTDKLEVIGQGQVPNFILHFTIHVLVGTNGETTATFTKMVSECK